MTIKKLYCIKFINDKVIINTSKTKLTSDIKKYIIENDLVNDGWYYPTTNQLDNYMNKRACCNLDFIKQLYTIDVVNYFNDIVINNKRENGREYNRKTIENKRNKIINEKLNDIMNNKINLDFNRLICIR